MHDSVLAWTAQKVAELGIAALPTLEVGSQDVNGSVRRFFSGPYTGVDMAEGRGVDVVASASALPFPDASFPVVVTTEMLEHDPRFWLSMKEIGRVLAPGGHLLLTTRGIGFPYHGFPNDYWRFTDDAIRELLQIAGVREVSLTPDPQHGHPGWLAHGRKELR